MKKLLFVVLLAVVCLVPAVPAFAWVDGWSTSDSISYHTADGYFTLYIKLDREHNYLYGTWETQRLWAWTNNTGHSKTFEFEVFMNLNYPYELPLNKISDFTMLVPDTGITAPQSTVNPYDDYGRNGEDESELQIGSVTVKWTDVDGPHTVYNVRPTYGDHP